MAETEEKADEERIDTFFNSSEDENEPAKADSDNDSVGIDDEEEEEDIQPGETPRERLREIGDTFELPKSGLIRPKHELQSMRLPQFVHVKEKGFAPEHFNSLEHDAEKTRLRKLNKIQTAQMNTIRWRYKPSQDDDDEEEGTERQSNARIVEWDDGSMHLFVGNKSFAIVKRQTAFSNAFPFAVHSSEMECHGAVTSTIALKPSRGFEDENHRMIALQVNRENAKRSRIETLEQTVNMPRLLQRRRAEAHRRIMAKQQKAKSKTSRKRGPGGRAEFSDGSESPMYADELDEAGNEYDNEFIASEDDMLDEEDAAPKRSRPKRRTRSSPPPAAAAAVAAAEAEVEEAAGTSSESDAGSVKLQPAFSSSDSEGEVKRKAPPAKRRTIIDEDSSESD